MAAVAPIRDSADLHHQGLHTRTVVDFPNHLARGFGRQRRTSVGAEAQRDMFGNGLSEERRE